MANKLIFMNAKIWGPLLVATILDIYSDNPEDWDVMYVRKSEGNTNIFSGAKISGCRERFPNAVDPAVRSWPSPNKLFSSMHNLPSAHVRESAFFPFKPFLTPDLRCFSWLRKRARRALGSRMHSNILDPEPSLSWLRMRKGEEM